VVQRWCRGAEVQRSRSADLQMRIVGAEVQSGAKVQGSAEVVQRLCSSDAEVM